MERLIEERHIDGHHVAIVETVTDEGSGFVVVADGVVANEDQPLGEVPSEEQIRTLLHSRGRHSTPRPHRP